MGFELRIGRTERALSKDAVEIANTYTENRNLINAIRAYATSDSLEQSMPQIPDLPEETLAFLQGPHGYGVANSWTRVFRNTFDLLDKYDEAGQFDPKDLEQITQAQQSVIEALGSRAVHLTELKKRLRT